MEFNRDEFLILLLKQLDNCTTWNEDRLIDRVLTKHDWARELKEAVRETYPEETGKHPYYYITKQHTPEPVEEIIIPQRNKPVIKRFNRRMALNLAAATLIAAVVIATLLRSPEKPAPVAQTAPPGVTLQMAKGEAVRLDYDTATIATKYALLNTNSAMLQFKVKPGSNGLQDNTIIVPDGHMYSITLSDGTVVHMNSATSLRFPFAFNGSNREVHIEGEAYFSVAHNAKQPFIVHSKGGDVTVLGTGFNINTYDNRFMVSLVSGKVSVKHKNGAKVALKPRQAAVLDTVKGKLLLKEFKSEEVLSWMQGQYHFVGQPLHEICKAAGRLYGVKVHFDSKKLAQLKYSCMISKKDSIGTFLQQLKDNGKVDDYYYDEDGVVHLSLSKSRVDTMGEL
jgi:ferric-dicitrate binding protein FerR (iron transport regulator)